LAQALWIEIATASSQRLGLQRLSFIG